MMCPAIHNPASCEVSAVIRFLHARNMSAAELIANYVRFMAKMLRQKEL
jgi:hypothetical protein